MKRERSGRHWLVADPDRGWRVLEHEVLLEQWQAAGFTMLVGYPSRAKTVARILDDAEPFWPTEGGES